MQIEHAPFIRAICERPGDDMPRLAFADWLDEHGESDRAEFIRVQCERAKRERPIRITPSIRPTKPGTYHVATTLEYDHGPDYDALRLREQELWHRLPTHKAFAPFTSGISTDPDEPQFWLSDQAGPLCEVRRGFVAAVTCTAAAFVGDGRTPGIAAELFRAQPVERVTLTTTPELVWSGMARGLKGDPAGRWFTWDECEREFRHGESYTETVLRLRWPGVEFVLLESGQ